MLKPMDPSSLMYSPMTFLSLTDQKKIRYRFVPIATILPSGLTARLEE